MLRRAGEDRIVAVEDRLHVDVRSRLRVVGVVAHPFAERTFRLDLTRHGFAFDRDLAVGRDREAGVGPAHHVDRFTAQPAGDVHLAHLGQRARRQHEQQRILAAQDHHFHRLSALEIFVAMNAAMLALGDLAADGLAVIDLAAIGAEVEPTRVRVLRHHAIGGADEARGVELVVARHRKLQHVDVVTLNHVLENGSVVDKARRQRLQVLHPGVIVLHDIDFALVFERQAQRQSDAARGRELAVERTVAFGIARHVVEQDRRRRAAALFREHVGDGTHLDVPVGAVDLAQLAHFVDLLEPSAQPAILHPLLRDRVSTDAGHAVLHVVKRSTSIRPCKMRARRRHHPRGNTCAHFARMRASSSLLERATIGKVARRDQGLQASMTTRALRGSSLL